MAGGTVGVGPGGAGTAPAPPPAPADRPFVVVFRERLSEVDGTGLTDRERLDLVAELERAKGAVAAAQARLSHALRVSREAAQPKDALRSVGSEVALARRCSPTLGDRFVGLARALVTEMPHTHAALSAGVCSERHVVFLVQATSVLSVDDRAEVDRRVGPLLGRLGVKAAERAARRVAAELDAAAVVTRMEAAVTSRRVTVRPAPDGMAYLTVLGPLVDVVGAHAALQARAKAVVGGQCPDEPADGRAVGPVSADTALSLLSGRLAPGLLQPVEVHLVMTDRALLGTGDPRRSPMEPARIPGHGSVPAPVARGWLRGAADAADPGSATGGSAVSADALPATPPPESVWLRRLYTSPDGRNLVAMDSRRRLFTGMLRRMLVLRDDVCTTPWCESLIAHADHGHPARDGGPTDFETGNGACARCNLTREAPAWTRTVRAPHRSLVPTVPAMTGPAPTDRARRQLDIRTPTGMVVAAVPPPLLGWGSEQPPAEIVGAPRSSRAAAAPTSGRRVRRPPKRARLTSRLERELCRFIR